MIQSRLWQLTGWPATSFGAASRGLISMWPPAITATPPHCCRDHWRWSRLDFTAHICSFHPSSPLTFDIYVVPSSLHEFLLTLSLLLLWTICYFQCIRRHFVMTILVLKVYNWWNGTSDVQHGSIYIYPLWSLTFLWAPSLLAPRLSFSLFTSLGKFSPGLVCPFRAPHPLHCIPPRDDFAIQQ